MSTTAVYSAPHQEVRVTEKKFSKNNGKLIGSLTGAGVGGSYVASTIKDTLAIQNAKAIGISKLLITCDVKNEASEKTILANGGVYEKTIDVDDCQIKRYWIMV